MNYDDASEKAYIPKAPGEREFFLKHVAKLHPDRGSSAPTKAGDADVKGHEPNGDDIFKGAAVKTYKRKKDRYGNDAGDDVKAYRSFAQESADTVNYGEVRKGGAIKAANRVMHKGTFWHSTGKQGTLDKSVVHEFHKHDDKKQKIWRHASTGHVVQPHHEHLISDVAKTQRGFSEQLEERVLTDHEVSKREDLVKSMKGSSGDFKKRYGGDWKSVMYATATKMAKEDVEITFEDLEAALGEETQYLDEVRRGMGRYDKKSGKFTYKVPARVYLDSKGRHFVIDPSGKRHLLGEPETPFDSMQEAKTAVKVGNFSKQDAVNYNAASHGTSGYENSNKISTKRLPKRLSDVESNIVDLHQQFDDQTNSIYKSDVGADPFSESVSILDQLVESAIETELNETHSFELVFKTGDVVEVTPELVAAMLETYQALDETNQKKFAELIDSSIDGLQEAVDFINTIRE
jgi:hypothetical protein